jgi:PEP-CTERM motif
MKLSPLAALALFAASPAFAVTIDFEAPASFAPIDNFYSAQNIGFGLDALAVQNDELGPYFSNAPSAIGIMAPVGGSATLNMLNGQSLVGGLSFWYSSTAAVFGGVEVWSGLNGTGNLLASFNLAANAKAGCGADPAPYCHFDQLTASFTGNARSVTFGNAANVAGFDNLNITAVPEPTSALLMALGVAGLLASRRRQQA